jgi:hypothetical protein
MRSLEEVPFLTSPSAPLKEASRLLLESRPPLLCQEGSAAPNSFTPPSTASTRAPSAAQTGAKREPGRSSNSG